MYKIEFIDLGEPVDPEFDTYDEVREAYINIVNMCMRYGIPLDISIKSLYTGDCPACTSYNPED